MEMESLETLNSKDGQKCAVCSIATATKCSRCKKVSYCGREHQKFHYKSHKGDCHPFIEAKSREFGRYLMATRDIVAGEIICTERPVMIGPETLDDLHPVCLGCCKVLSGTFFNCSQICPKCSWPLCQPDCKDIAWHSNNECAIFQAKNVTPLKFLHYCPSPIIYDFIKILRILLLKEKDPIKFKKIADLESHIGELGNSDKGRVDLESVLHFFSDLIQMDPYLYPVDLIVHIFGVVMINSNEAYHQKITPGLRCDSFIYEMGSKLCHSCCGNTKTVTANNTQRHRITAVKDIKRGEMITQFYAQDKIFFRGIFERRSGLARNYHFWCRCPRCEDKTELGTYSSAIKCQNNKRKEGQCPGYYLPLNSLDTATDPIWSCNVCTKKDVYSSFSSLLELLNGDISRASSYKEKLDVLDRHANRTVHENHFLLMKLRYDLVHQLFSARFAVQRGTALHLDLSAKMEACAEKCLQVVDKLATGLSEIRGYFLFYLAQGKTTQCFDQNVDHCEIREECKRIYSVSREGSEGQQIYKYLMEEKELGQLLQQVHTPDEENRAMEVLKQYLLNSDS